MIKTLFDTDFDRTLTFLRLVVGSIMLAHGAQKMLGIFGGPGYEATMNMFGQMGIAAPLGMLAISAEFFGSLFLMFGFLGRVSALGIIVVMAVAIATVHLPNGFFMNWAGTQQGEGFEYHLLTIGLAAPIMVSGAGAWSVDRRIAQWIASHGPTTHGADRLRHAHVH